MRALAIAAVSALAHPAAGQSTVAGAQNYPAKPVRMIVAFPASGGSDIAKWKTIIETANIPNQ
ncbi:MAG: hypothetical protein HYY78_19060 [Betaproteobacteria bacterium]|nr:hypothetical protein [Betaproteobacteria bacterium]